MIERASEADLPAIVSIFNEVVATSTAIYRDDPTTLAERAAWLRERCDQGFPVLVARDRDGYAIGMSSYGSFRPWPGYATTVEHTVLIDAAHRRRGHGRQLVQALLDIARQNRIHAMIGGVDAENVGSLRMHESLGFVEVGRLPEVARKFERWVDLVFLQRRVPGP
jgi:L-amino acid N-acyltransferase YncA